MYVGIIVAGDMINYVALSFIQGLIIRMDKHEPHGVVWLVVHVYTMGFRHADKDLGCGLYVREA